MNNRILKTALLVAVSMAPAGYLASIWESVPQTIATHIGSNGPDAWGNKSELWTPVAGISGLSLLVYFLLLNLHNIDPKRASKPASPIFGKLATGMLLFMAALNFILIRMMAQNANVEHALFPLIGLLFAFVGNAMHNIKPNYFAGIRVPWTLNSDYNWRKTHQMGGKLWFAGGLVVAAISFFVPLAVSAIMAPVLLGIMALVPIVYSFFLFRREQANPDLANEDQTTGH